MKRINNLISLTFLTILFISINNHGYSQSTTVPDKPAVPKVITFNPDTTAYQVIFDGDKDSVVFYSGVVTVAPNKSAHVHSTEIYEEMIVVLEGQGQVRITNNKNLDLKFGNIAFIPPNTEHQVFNTGTKNFKYIYVATKAEVK
jgi:mannose-6-phosphate isomerase-like protein (cupin superfamily)